MFIYINKNVLSCRLVSSFTHTRLESNFQKKLFFCKFALRKNDSDLDILEAKLYSIYEHSVILLMKRFICFVRTSNIAKNGNIHQHLLFVVRLFTYSEALKCYSNTIQAMTMLSCPFQQISLSQTCAIHTSKT